MDAEALEKLADQIARKMKREARKSRPSGAKKDEPRVERRRINGRVVERVIAPR